MSPKKSIAITRRLIAGIAITPLIALTYLLIYTGLVALGAEPTNTALGVWFDGLWLGGLVSLVFALTPLTWKTRTRK